jgi:hypothetical protein
MAETKRNSAAGCFRTVHVSAKCSACQQRIEGVAHIPMQMSGIYCTACCPSCAKRPTK